MEVTEAADAQAGVLSRRQALDLGLSAAQIKHRVRSGRWCRLLPGVFATFSGEVGDQARVWAAVLYCGQGAAVAGRSALWLWRAEDRLGSRIEIVVPHGRAVIAQPGIVVRSARGLEPRVHRMSGPPRLRLEEAALDVIATAPTEAQVIDVLVRVVQRRLTTAGRLGVALDNRRRCRWRVLVREVLLDVGSGVQSMLEHEYLVRVERAHGLPVAVRNAPTATPGGIVYRDLKYEAYGVLVELDGEEFHPGELRFRDRIRDNLVLESGGIPLRYGWREVTTTSCDVGAQVAGRLRAGGWKGRPRSCGPSCSTVATFMSGEPSTAGFRSWG